LSRSCDELRAHFVRTGLQGPLPDDLAGQLGSDIPEALAYILSSVKKMDALLAGLLRFSRLGRIAVKLVFFSSQLEIYRSIAAAPALAEAPPADMPAAAPDEC